MNQAILYLLGLTAIFVMCSAEPLEKRQFNEPDYPEGKKFKGKIASQPECPKDKGEGEKVCFKECRKLARSGLFATCNDDELAVGCRTTGFGACRARQTFNAQGCMIDTNSCGKDFEEASLSDGKLLKALCCKRKAVLFV